MGDNGAGGVTVWIRINISYILRLNLHDIEAGVNLNCDRFSVIPGVDKYFILLIFLQLFCFEVYLFFFIIRRRTGEIGVGIIQVETNPSIVGITKDGTRWYSRVQVVVC